eukprot:gene4402-4655_t
MALHLSLQQLRSPWFRDEEQRQRERWEREAEERQLEAERAERARLVRKERSERIPTQPKRNQDPVIFQALTREWDEKVTQEEYRGARAAVRKIARVGLEDRNRKIRNIRKKILQEAKQASQGRKELDEETARLAQQASEQLKYAAALSIPKTREQLFAEAAGVKRSFARAEALPEGEWERLKTEYKTLKHPIKIGRQGAKPSLIQAIQMAWRGSEVVKLAIHDEKASRNANLPRMNLLLRELEERSGGVLIDTSGRSIWLYRGVDWVPAPVKPAYKPPAEEDSSPQSNLLTGGRAEGNKAGGYWLSRHWPVVKKRKLEYFDWYKTGPGVAVACMSPTTFMFDSELSKNLRVPVAMLPAKYDTMDQLMNLVKLLNRPYLPRCLFRRFGKVKPGWASWLPQWIDNRAMFQAAETLLLAVGYLRRELVGDDSSPLLQLVLEEQREAEAELQLRIQQKFGYDKQPLSDQQDLEVQQQDEEEEEEEES